MKKISFFALLCAIFITTNAFAEGQPEESPASATTETTAAVTTPYFEGPDWTCGNPNSSYDNFYCYYTIKPTYPTGTSYIWELNGEIWTDGSIIIGPCTLIEYPYFSSFGYPPNNYTATLRCKVILSDGSESAWSSMRMISISSWCP